MVDGLELFERCRVPDRGSDHSEQVRYWAGHLRLPCPRLEYPRGAFVLPRSQSKSRREDGCVWVCAALEQLLQESGLRRVLVPPVLRKHSGKQASDDMNGRKSAPRMPAYEQKEYLEESSGRKSAL